MVSKASDDLPEPDRPVITTNLSRGMSTSMFRRLCTRAPRTAIHLRGIRTHYYSKSSQGKRKKAKGIASGDTAFAALPGVAGGDVGVMEGGVQQRFCFRDFGHEAGDLAGVQAG